MKRNRVIAGLLALALIGTALAYAQAWRGAAPRMTGGPMAGMGMMAADEFSFLASMIPHHQEAIESAKLLLGATERPELRGLAEGIISTQTAEIVVLREILAANYPGRETEIEATLRAYRPMMQDLTGLAGQALDRAFLRDMIRHHMMAVMMSRQVLSVRSTPETRELALSIIGDQTREIAQMQTWLRDWFGARAGRMGGPMGGMMGPRGGPCW